MKKILLVAFLFLGVQNYAQKMIQFGPMISVNTASVSTSAPNSSGTDMSYGGFLRANVLLFYGQAELGYGTTKFSLGNSEYQLSGLNTNLIVGFKIIPLGKVGNLRILAGYNWSDYSNTSSNNGGASNYFSNSNSSVITGLGVDFWKLTFDARYLIGTTDVVSTTETVKVDSFNACLGFKF